MQPNIAVVNPHLAIRNALPADAQNISALIHGEAHYCTINPFGEDAEHFFSTITPEAIAGYISNPNFIYLLGFIEVELAGGSSSPRRKAPLPLVRRLQISPRSGIASYLRECAKTRALESGNTEGFTVNSTPFAVPVYEQFGFQIQGARVEDKGVTFIPMKLPRHVQS